MTAELNRRDELKAAIDRFGADLAAWPDASLANAAREAALADRDVRGALDDRAALDANLRLARDDTDAEIVQNGSVGRVTSRVLAATGGSLRRGWWVSIAAALVIAAALGSALDLSLFQAKQQPFDVVVVDPLVFGSTEVGTQ